MTSHGLADGQPLTIESKGIHHFLGRTQILEHDVVCSKAFATEEVERFTFRSPGQAVSYFDGFTRLLEIRQAAEKALGPKFNVQKFHDFILSQGLLPPALLRKAVLEELPKT